MSNTESGDSASRSGITFGKRLEAMETEEVVDVMSEMKTQKKPKELPKAGSQEVLISQYLESGNYFHMDSIINATSRKTIGETVKRLNVKYVLPLLDLFIMKLEDNPRRGTVIMIWLKAILCYHSSFLMSVPYLQQRLSLLMRLLTDRYASYKRLYATHGRLAFILGYARSLERGDIDFAKAKVPLVKVEEEALEMKVDSSSEELSDEEEREEAATQDGTEGESKTQDVENQEDQDNLESLIASEGNADERDGGERDQEKD